MSEQAATRRTRGGREGKKKMSWGKRILLTLVVLVLLGVACAAVAYFVTKGNIDSNIEKIDDVFAPLPDRPEKPEDDEDDAANEAVNILVLGSDSRISAGDPTQWSVGGQRTDAIMLVHIAAHRESAHIMSIPRDSWVPIPGHGEAKINAAFSYGGPSLMIQTVEQLTGVYIDHFAVTDFESFKAITDSLGGVDIFDPTVGANVQMDGEQALAFVRDRYGRARGDFDRVQAQQAWMRAIMAKTLTSETLTNPARALDLLQTVSQSVAVDDNFTIDEMQSLLLSARNMRSGDVTFFTVPYSGTGRSTDGQSIVVLDRPNFDDLMIHVREDRVDEFLDNTDSVDRLN